MDTSWRLWAKRGTKLLLTGVATWLIFRGVGLGFEDLTAIDVASLTLDPVWLGVSVVLLLIAFAASAWLWRGLVDALGGGRIPATQALAMVLVSNLGRYIPGKVFQLAGLAWLSKRGGTPPATAAAAAVLGQTLHLLAAGLVGGALVTQTDFLTRSWGIGVLVAILVLVAVLSWRGALGRLVGWILQRLDGQAPAGLAETSLLPWLAGYLMNWIRLGVAFYCLMGGLGVDTSLALATTAFAAAYLLGYLALFAPAGIGVREGFLVAFLGPVLGPSTAWTVAAIQRAWITAAEVLGALLAWPALRARGQAPLPAPGE